MKPALPLGVMLCAALALTGCGKPATAGQSAKTVATLPASTVPATIGGLTAQPESVEKVIKMAGGVLTYADQVGYWSLRENKLVQGTLQVTHLGSSARVKDPKFIATLVQSLMVTATATRIGRYDVYLGQGATVNSAVWLEGSYVLELSTRPTYVFPRTLLEGAVAVNV